MAERLARGGGQARSGRANPKTFPRKIASRYRDEELCRKIGFLKSAVVISSEGTNERAIITQARKQAQEVKAVENFKRQFDYDDPDKANTGIAFLVVCDMLLTGFDAPSSR